MRALSSKCCLTAVAVVPLVLCGCVALEFDRMTGTTFPPDQMIGAETHSIDSIYADAAFVVTVEEDDTTIDPLQVGDDDCISDAELDALEAAHRDSPLFPDNETYYLYGVVVDHYGEVLDACSPNWVIGKMWDHHTRSAFALFYPHSTIQSSGAEYLRTTVHEIGHALNLHHEDGDGMTTIMTQTGDLASDWVYEFSPESLDHLQNHPPTCKFPGAIGGAPFTWVIAAHHALHPGVSTQYDCN